MRHKKIIWIMVANGSVGKIFKNNGSKLHIIQIFEASSQEAHLHDRDIRIDRPGRVFESANSARHALEPKMDLHRQEKVIFAQHIASFLNKGTNTKKFDELILIASPEFLGDMRLALNKRAHELIRKEINKDLTHLKEKEILGYIFESNR